MRSILSVIRSRDQAILSAFRLPTDMKKARKCASRAQHYHHGDLRAALVGAADDILAEQGLEGFTLRATARRAGVSIAAPAHHFGTVTGLLSEVAKLAFDALATHLDVSAIEATPTQRLRMQGKSYVRFALAHPGRFHLMFRCDLLDDEHPGLREAAGRAFAQLEQTVRAKYALDANTPLDSTARATLLAAWSMVHGFAHLALDGKLADMSDGAAPEDALDRALSEMLINQWPD